MKARTRAALVAPALSLAGLLAVTGPASAADGTAQGDLTPVPLNGVDGSGEAMVWVEGTTLTVEFAASGLLAGSPHAAHLHYGEDAKNQCPVEGDDADGSGTITTSEGVPSYGSVQVSLTTEGDTSGDSALAVDRFDTAEGGEIDYQRGEIEVSQDLADDILAGDVALVVHGVDHDGSGAYDGDTESDLDPSLPAEATDPALCGILAASQMDEMPAGGVQTGTGGTAGTENLGLIAGGGVALLAGAGLTAGLVARRRTVGQDS
ncbi:hypothetical protein BCE75_10882 [Isoptericola sp. CG 20/1183]|uniref:CHRD domain-containing protein n=1 Tax=Isoptericola halotolerans TaxID=300560 RepID=A0ABX5EC14_9MICO|nr:MULTISPECIES: hypothetical protein [Isoptericola]PRZ05104.1 hypothetical protein BCL65_10883 [Isoptericola halotolerans]PRZ05842.1 hypothetical protein BCE75_10882 [Isoptericola sp. CG 20/1183]